MKRIMEKKSGRALIKYAFVLLIMLFFATENGMAFQVEREYLIVPEDEIGISVWREKDLTLSAKVRPDGKISFPLIGDVEVAGHTVDSVRTTMQEMIREYIPEAVVSVMMVDMKGMFISVVGKVNKPGASYSNRRLNVMQAISLAGGLARFAREKKIVILRTKENGQIQIPFNYAQVKKGKRIDQNIMLKDGDIIVVP